MKKTLLLILLLIISTNSYALNKDYYIWGDLDDGGIKSIVPYPKDTGARSYSNKVNPSSYGKYLGFSVFIKTTNVNDKVRPYIFLQNKYKKHIKTKWGEDIKGTTSWKRYYTPHIYIPSHAKWVIVGVQINGTGKVELYDYKIKEYSYK
jgi:putative lipoic acid-binding regulatory protein